MKSRWSSDVRLKFSAMSAVVVISESWTASRILLTRWPQTSGTAFWAAQEICLAATEGRASHDEAREAFVEAAREALILVD